MKQNTMTLGHAFNEVSASSAGGAPFLIAYGLTFIVSGMLSYVLPAETAALVVMFQGGVALPLAFWLERRLGWGRMAATIHCGRCLYSWRCRRLWRCQR